MVYIIDNYVKVKYYFVRLGILGTEQNPLKASVDDWGYGCRAVNEPNEHERRLVHVCSFNFKR